jgi:hypothetical protein
LTERVAVDQRARAVVVRDPSRNDR